MGPQGLGRLVAVGRAADHRRSCSSSIFIGYLLVRKYGGPGSEKLAAATAHLRLAVAPFVYKSVDIWRTIHPKTSVVPTLPRVMAGPFWC